MISRKHFQLIADELKKQRPSERPISLIQWDQDVKAVARALAKLNTRFDFDRFYEACGLVLTT